MKQKRGIDSKRGTMAISQIFILVIGIMSISFLIGLANVELVSGAPTYTIEGGDTYWDLNKKYGLNQGTLEALNPTISAKNLPIGGKLNLPKAVNSLPGTLTNPTTTTLKPSKLSEFLGVEELELEKGETADLREWKHAGGGMDAIFTGAQWAFITYGIVSSILSFTGLDEDQKSAASLSLSAGVGVGKGVGVLLGKGGALSQSENSVIKFFMGKLGASSTSFVAGAAVALIIFAITYKNETKKVVTFNCYPWDAPVGGNNCEECNEQGLPCSEYQCKSLGQACELLNKGTDEENCVWVNRNDVNPPVITSWEGSLLDDYSYSKVAVSPPDSGVKINYNPSADNCIPAFAPFTFGITTDEPSKCKIDPLRRDSFDDMPLFFGGSSTSKYNHTQIMSLPGPSSLEAENLTIENGGEFELYVRCQDANGNTDPANFVFKYCVDEGPDTTPPLIVTTNPLNGMPVAYNQSAIDLEVYVNEPARCSWSTLDRDYENMPNEMDCSTSVFEMNAQLLYKCSSELTGLKDREENKFFFRCEDQPNADKVDRNINVESYKFSLIGTEPLFIDSVLPNETISDSTNIVKVNLEAETSAGHDEGMSTCYYSETGESDDYIMFFYESEKNNLDYTHSQELNLAEGEYEYFIKCIDQGGNADVANTTFEVDTDNEAPIVVRTYHLDNYLVIITNEEGECVYGTNDCNYLFEDGKSIQVTEEVEHFVDWDNENSLYVKCQDNYNNRPNPDQCSIIAKPFAFSVE